MHTNIQLNLFGVESLSPRSARGRRRRTRTCAVPTMCTIPATLAAGHTAAGVLAGNSGQPLECWLATLANFGLPCGHLTTQGERRIAPCSRGPGVDGNASVRWTLLQAQWNLDLLLAPVEFSRASAHVPGTSSNTGDMDLTLSTHQAALHCQWLPAAWT